MAQETMNNQHALIFGATGNVGGAAARELLRRGWHVRAVTRNPQSAQAQALASLGAEVVRADMDDRPSLEAAFAGMTRVFSVQNWSTSGVEGEIRQGKLVADVANEARVTHLVYGSAGVGVAGTGVPHFEGKVLVESHMRELGLPVTVVRPAPFMELMTRREFFPPLAAWGTMPNVLGWDLPLPWVAVQDIGVAIANIFAQPDVWIGRDVNLIGDVQSIRACRNLFKQVTGRRPFGVPLPAALFNRMAGPELMQMWRWTVGWSTAEGPERLQADLVASRLACPTPHSVESWLREARAGATGL